MIQISQFYIIIFHLKFFLMEINDSESLLTQASILQWYSDFLHGLAVMAVRINLQVSFIREFLWDGSGDPHSSFGA